MLIFVLTALLAAGQSSDLIQARKQLDTVRRQAADGLLPVSVIADAEERVADAADQTILDRTLYGRLQIQDLTEGQVRDMVAAAQRRLDRAGKKIEPIRKLVDQGIADRARLVGLQADFSARQTVLHQARARAALVMGLVAMARAEAEPLPAQAAAVKQVEVRVDGDHVLDPEDIREITLAFEKQFREPLPISARGETAVHRALGFDHTGRIDVALMPDSPEGLWLQNYLEARSIPFYAFRAAVPGKATAAHIHIGPPSTRLHIGD